MNTGTTLLKTVHGSRLYGLSHAQSDYDMYVVTVEDSLRKVRHTIQGENDVTRIQFDEFLRHCHNGIPQALEALYSPIAEVDERIHGVVAGFVVGSASAVKGYTGAINHLVLEVNNEKSRRHALRLSLNLYDILTRSRFTPVLTPSRIDFVTKGAQLSQDKFLELLDATCPVEWRKILL